MALAQARETCAVLVTELSRWGRSTVDLLHTLEEMHARRVSVIARGGLAFELATPRVRMMAAVLGGVAQFERELIQERVRSGLAAARAEVLGRRPGQRPSDRVAHKVVAMIEDEGLSYRAVARRLDVSKNTVLAIMKRHRATRSEPTRPA